MIIDNLSLYRRLGALAAALALTACDGAATDPADCLEADCTSTPDAGSSTPDAGASTSDAGVDVLDPPAYAAIIMGGRWADDMMLSFADDALTIADDGLPDHAVLQGYAVPDGTMTGVVATPYELTIPMTPLLAAAPTAAPLGAIGVAISGGLLFNPYEGDGTTIALDGNFEVGGAPFIDACNGHPVGTGTQYHYHGVPYCITDTIDVVGQHSVLLGVLLDGFPLYGPLGADGAAPTDLDACRGHEGATPEFPSGIYHYHLTETAPYSIPCYSGEIEVQGGGGPGGPGGPGGDVLDCANAQAGQPCCGDAVCDGPETAANCSEDCG